MLDTRRLQVLAAVARHGSLTAAARALALVPSAVSQQIAALERETGHQLLLRGPRGVQLTDAGRLLLEHADEVFASIARAEAALSALRGLTGGRLHVASFPTAGGTLVARAAAIFAKRHPAIELLLIEAEPPEALAMLKSGDVDLAVTYEYDLVPAPLEPALDVRVLCDDAMWLVLPVHHAALESGPVTLRDLRAERWIVGGETMPASVLTLAICRQAGFEPLVGGRTDTYAVAQSWVAAGLGVTLVPGLAVVPMPQTTARPLEQTQLSRRILTVSRGQLDSPVVTAMRDALDDTVKASSLSDDHTWPMWPKVPSSDGRFVSKGFNSAVLPGRAPCPDAREEL